MLESLAKPGLFITGTDTDVGKTVVAGAIAQWLRRDGRSVGVFKPVASGCVRRREGLVSEDAEFLAHCADARFPLDMICPQRYAEPLAPGVAGEREKRTVEWEEVQRSLSIISEDSEVVVVEGAGGIMVPVDAKHTVLDVAVWLKAPAVVVARASLGTINHTLLTVNALRSRGVKVAGVVINRYPADTPELAEETNPRAIEKWGKVSVLCVIPECRFEEVERRPIPPEVASAIGRVDWMEMAKSKG